MSQILTPSQFTSPDIRPTGAAALQAADTADQAPDMVEIQEQLAEALLHIQGLRPSHPSEAHEGKSRR